MDKIFFGGNHEVSFLKFCSGGKRAIVEYKENKPSTPYRQANIGVAIFVTCHSRLKLFRELKELGERALYCDTDSIVFLAHPQLYEPPLGWYLGSWTDEVKPGSKIVEFSSNAAKSYYYITRDEAGREETHMRCKGIRLNTATKRILTSQTMLRVFRDNVEVKVPQTIFKKNKKNIGLIKTIEFEKTYRRVLRKRTFNFDTETSRPLGYKSPRL